MSSHQEDSARMRPTYVVFSLWLSPGVGRFPGARDRVERVAGVRGVEPTTGQELVLSVSERRVGKVRQKTVVYLARAGEACSHQLSNYKGVLEMKSFSY